MAVSVVVRDRYNMANSLGAASFEAYASSPVPATDVNLTDGTGAGQANAVWENSYVIAASGTVDLNLQSLTDYAGNALVFTAIKLVKIYIDSPDGIKEIKFGPLGQSNAWPGWWGGVSATDYTKVRQKFENADQYVGWAVGASTKTVRLLNSTAGSVTVYV